MLQNYTFVPRFLTKFLSHNTVYLNMVNNAECLATVLKVCSFSSSLFYYFPPIQQWINGERPELEQFSFTCLCESGSVTIDEITQGFEEFVQDTMNNQDGSSTKIVVSGLPDLLISCKSPRFVFGAFSKVQSIKFALFKA